MVGLSELIIHPLYPKSVKINKIIKMALISAGIRIDNYDIRESICRNYLEMKLGTPDKNNGSTPASTQNQLTARIQDPLMILREEHDRGLQELEKISAAIGSIQKNGFSADAFAQIAESVRYIGSEMRKHYEKEERHLFPLLDKHLFESPNEIRYERREMWQSYNELINAIRDVEDGRSHGSTVRDLLQCALRVVEHFRNHINRENDVILPMVKRLLTSDEYLQFGKEIQSITYL